MKMIAAFAAAACLFAACQQQKSPEQEKKPVAEEAPPLYLGAVHQVYPEQGFALLRIIGPMPKAGSTLITHPADGSVSRIGNLEISTGQPARNGIIAADIRSGTVVKGDRVFQYRDIAQHPGKEQEAAPEAAGAEDSADSPSVEGEASLPSPTKAPMVEEPVTSPAEGIDVTLLPDNEPTPGSTLRPVAPPAEVPDYLKEIPTDIKGWE